MVPRYVLFLIDVFEFFFETRYLSPRAPFIFVVGIVSRSAPAYLLAKYSFEPEEFFAPAESVPELGQLDLYFCFFGRGTPVEYFKDQEVAVDYTDVCST